MSPGDAATPAGDGGRTVEQEATGQVGTIVAHGADTVPEKPLSDSERNALANFESKIEAGIKTFMQVGTCLATIRDGRLYRESYPSFEDYLDGRWGMGRSHAYRMIDAAATVAEIEAVSPIGDILTAESQVREIADLPPEVAVEVIEAAVEKSGGKPTAKAIREARESIAPKQGKPPKPKAGARPRPRLTADKRQVRDNLAREIEDRVTQAEIDLAAAVAEAEDLVGRRIPITDDQAHDIRLLLDEVSRYAARLADLLDAMAAL